MSEDTTVLDLDSVLDANMDDIPDVAGFVTPSRGVYNLAITSCKLDTYTTQDSKEEKNRIKMMYEVVQCLEKANDEDEDTPIGGVFTETFQLNADGLKYFKSKAKQVLGTTEGLTIGESIKAVHEAQAVVKASVKTKATPKLDSNGAKTGDSYINVQVRILEVTEDIPFPTKEEFQVEAALQQEA